METLAVKHKSTPVTRSRKPSAVDLPTQRTG